MITTTLQIWRIFSTFEGGRGSEGGGGVGGLEKRIDEQRKITQGKKGQIQAELRNFYNGRRTHEIRLFYVIITHLYAVVSQRVGSTVAVLLHVFMKKLTVKLPNCSKQIKLNINMNSFVSLASVFVQKMLYIDIQFDAGRHHFCFL
jgi:hypothetical protein